MSKRFRIVMYFGVGIIVASAVFIFFFCNHISFSLKNPQIEIGSSAKVSDLIDIYSNGELQNSDMDIDTSSIGEHPFEVHIKDNFGNVRKYTTTYSIVDTTPPVIEGPSAIDCFLDEDINLISYFTASDNSNEDVTLNIENDYTTTISGDYALKVVASDKYGNNSSYDFTLSVGKMSLAALEQLKRTKSEYYIKINRLLNVVMVYTLDNNGEYTKLAKVFVCSTGKPGSETPLGTFKVSDRYETLFLVGNVWGHYTLRIKGSIFFHSVPYFTKGSPWDDLEYEEYNKLGNGASAGCVRLSTIDAKWIFDNIASGTTVEIYDSESLPEGVLKPEAIKIDVDNANRGWDPTDPDERNPWN